MGDRSWVIGYGVWHLKIWHLASNYPLIINYLCFFFANNI